MTLLVYHHEFFGNNWPVVGDRYAEFRKILGEVEKKVKLDVAEPVEESLLEKIHSRNFLEVQRKEWYYQAAKLSVGGSIKAAVKVWKNEINNALTLNVAAGHHAGKESAWGGTYLNIIGPLYLKLRDLGLRRMFYLDTDAHHGDGDREILSDFSEVVHVCFCSSNNYGAGKLCVNSNYLRDEEAYISRLRETLEKFRGFKPDIVIHFLGHDTHAWEYGSLGLSTEFFGTIASEVKDFAEEVCEGRYVIIHGGGADPKITSKVLQVVVDSLAES
jgi:acetoin utilization deacetylase AcuC-like enzyme